MRAIVCAFRMAWSPCDLDFMQLLMSKVTTGRKCYNTLMFIDKRSRRLKRVLNHRRTMACVSENLGDDGRYLNSDHPGWSPSCYPLYQRFSNYGIHLLKGDILSSRRIQRYKGVQTNSINVCIKKIIQLHFMCVFIIEIHLCCLSEYTLISLCLRNVCLRQTLKIIRFIRHRVFN